ncbi:MAG: hypothetical protein QXX08_04960 [Candidatus Bathyarchaeia archaeon]
MPREIDEISIEEFLRLPDKSDEQRVREVLEKEFGKKLPKKRVTIGYYTHEFDLFAEDGTIVGEVKSGRDLDKNGKIKPYRFAELCLDCLYLMGVKAEKKLFVLTDKRMFDAFNKMIKGLPIKEIEIRLVELKYS